jgi:valyl-tRNA synthetase
MSEQGMTLPESKAIWNMDKHKGKPFFNRIITYTFYVYNKDSIYRNLNPSQREEKVMSVYFPEVRNRSMEDDRVKAFIKAYNYLTKSSKERIRDTMLKDLEEMALKLSNIKFTKQKKVNQPVFVHCPHCQKDVTVDVDMKIDIDNTEEKLKAMKVIEEIMKREEEIKKKIDQERLAEKGRETVTQRMFDN